MRHGRPVIEPTRPPDQWRLEPGGLADVDRLRHSGALPAKARWFSSPERKALETARRLTDGVLSAADVTVLPALAEQRRGAHWFDDDADFRLAVRRAFRRARGLARADLVRPDERCARQFQPAVQGVGRTVSN